MSLPEYTLYNNRTTHYSRIHEHICWELNCSAASCMIVTAYTTFGYRMWNLISHFKWQFCYTVYSVSDYSWLSAYHQCIKSPHTAFKCHWWVIWCKKFCVILLFLLCVLMYEKKYNKVIWIRQLICGMWKLVY